jgi:hypothetical protein
MTDTVSLRAVYRPILGIGRGGQLDGEAPQMYVVTARGVSIDTPDPATAWRLFRRWAVPEEES